MNFDSAAFVPHLKKVSEVIFLRMIATNFKVFLVRLTRTFHFVKWKLFRLCKVNEIFQLSIRNSTKTPLNCFKIFFKWDEIIFYVFEISCNYPKSMMNYLTVYFIMKTSNIQGPYQSVHAKRFGELWFLESYASFQVRNNSKDNVTVSNYDYFLTYTITMCNFAPHFI